MALLHLKDFHMHTHTSIMNIICILSKHKTMSPYSVSNHHLVFFILPPSLSLWVAFPYSFPDKPSPLIFPISPFIGPVSYNCLFQQLPGYILASKDSELDPQIGENLWCLSFWPWVTTLCIVFSSFIHLLQISIFFTAE